MEIYNTKKFPQGIVLVVDHLELSRIKSALRMLMEEYNYMSIKYSERKDECTSDAYANHACEVGRMIECIEKYEEEWCEYVVNDMCKGGEE